MSLGCKLCPQDTGTTSGMRGANLDWQNVVAQGRGEVLWLSRLFATALNNDLDFLTD